VKPVEPQANRYEVSKAAVRDGDAPVRRPIGTLIIASIEALIGLTVAIRFPVTIGNFEELFKGFGADLPGLTRFVLATRYGWWNFVLVAVGILVWIVRRPPVTYVAQRRQMYAVAAYAVAIGYAWCVSVYALYLPIFRLGAAT